MVDRDDRNVNAFLRRFSAGGLQGAAAGKSVANELQPATAVRHGFLSQVNTTGGQFGAEITLNALHVFGVRFEQDHGRRSFLERPLGKHAGVPPTIENDIVLFDDVSYV